jgi:hypothetical protein
MSLNPQISTELIPKWNGYNNDKASNNMQAVTTRLSNNMLTVRLKLNDCLDKTLRLDPCALLGAVNCLFYYDDFTGLLY